MTQVFARGRMGWQLDWVPPGGDAVAPDRSIDAAVALQHWSLPEPWTVAPASTGLTNTTLFVETPTGTYVLRLYERADPAGVRFEHGLLAELAAAHLPFTLPAPVRTRAGETFAQVVVGGATVLASLTPLLPGTHPDPDDVQHARRLGEALGHLGQALAGVAPPPGRAQYPRLGDLRGFHPTLDDPARSDRAHPVPCARRPEAPVGDDGARRGRGAILVRESPGGGSPIGTTCPRTSC